MSNERSSFSYSHPRPSVTVDCVIFGIDANGGLSLLLVRRRSAPFRAMWALPGGFVRVRDDGDQGEGVDEAARRELKEETSLSISYLEQLCTFGTPGRDPRGRVISVAYMALVREGDHSVVGGSDAAEARWHPIASVLNEAIPLAFDHREIVRTAFSRLQAKIRYAPIGFNLLPPAFTLSDLQHLYEAILQRSLDKRNFRRRILAMNILAPSGRQKGVPHRAAALYRFDKRAYERAVRLGFNFEI